jgi:elongation factor G
MKVTVTAPDTYLGDIMGDMNKRRGRIISTDQDGENSIVICEAPESEILDYTAELRSFTQGRGRFTQEFERYEEVPFEETSKIIEEAKKDKE